MLPFIRVVMDTEYKEILEETAQKEHGLGLLRNAYQMV